MQKASENPENPVVNRVFGPSLGSSRQAGEKSPKKLFLPGDDESLVVDCRRKSRS